MAFLAFVNQEVSVTGTNVLTSAHIDVESVYRQGEPLLVLGSNVDLCMASVGRCARMQCTRGELVNTH